MYPLLPAGGEVGGGGGGVEGGDQEGAGALRPRPR